MWFPIPSAEGECWHQQSVFGFDDPEPIVTKYLNESALHSAMASGKTKPHDKVMFPDERNVWIACVVAKNGTSMHRLGMFWNNAYGVLFLNQIDSRSL